MYCTPEYSLATGSSNKYCTGGNASSTIILFKLMERLENQQTNQKSISSMVQVLTVHVQVQVLVSGEAIDILVQKLSSCMLGSRPRNRTSLTPGYQYLYLVRTISNFVRVGLILACTRKPETL